MEALSAGEPTAPKDFVLALTAAWSLSELVGRGQTLFQLREHMATKPSAALSEAWLQGKADEVRRRELDADLVEQQIDLLKGRDTISVREWIAALERLSMMRGSIARSAAELQLINQNLASYYRGCRQRARQVEQCAELELVLCSHRQLPSTLTIIQLVAS